MTTCNTFVCKPCPILQAHFTLFSAVCDGQEHLVDAHNRDVSLEPDLEGNPLQGSSDEYADLESYNHVIVKIDGTDVQVIVISDLLSLVWE